MFGAYVHVPFCASRCGYCDFNTYTAAELHRAGTTVGPSNYVEFVTREIEWTRRKWGPTNPLATVFLGGGTPTLLSPAAIGTVLTALRDQFGFQADAEVTVEANPDSVDERALAELRATGVTRVSFGHQSSAPQVLAFLERTHTPGRTWDAVRWARAAGFDQVSVDLIYGSQVESEDDLRHTLAEVVASGVDHVSAYSLIVEPGTRLAARVTRGEVPPPSDDVAAHRYTMIDQALGTAGLQWYEISNWARPGAECRHNLGYWRGGDWLGIGPGAHAHRGGLRSWNIKQPAAWAVAVAAGHDPSAGSEQVDALGRRREAIMLGLRLREGISQALLDQPGAQQAAAAQREGLLECRSDRWTLTDRGRLLADGVVSRLWG